MGPDDISAERLAHGYAITAHRSQGSTVDVAHVLDDGGGRELAYVAMSRARTASHIYVTALDPDHAAQRLTWGWDQQRRQQWITHRHHLAAQTAARTAELVAERDRLAASIPPDVTDQLTRLRHQIAQIEADRADLHAGTGRWADTPVRHAHQALQDAQRSHDHDQGRAHDPHLGLWARHRARKAEQTSAINLTQADTVWQETIRPYDEQLGMQQRPARQDVRTSSRPPSRPAPTSSPPTPTSSSASANSITPSPKTNDSRSNKPDHRSSRPGPPSNLACVTTPTSNTSTTSKSPKPSTLHRSAAPESDHSSGGEGHQLGKLMEADGSERCWSIVAGQSTFRIRRMVAKSRTLAGLGDLLAQQLIAAPAQEVPPTCQRSGRARVRLLNTGDTHKNDPNDARSVAIAGVGGTPSGAARAAEDQPRCTGPRPRPPITSNLEGLSAVGCATARGPGCRLVAGECLERT